MAIDLTKKYGIESFEDSRLSKVFDYCNVYKILLDGKIAFIKASNNDRYLCSELIGVELADLLGVKRVSITTCKVSGKRYFVSYASYDSEEQFILGNELFEKFYKENKAFVDKNPDFYGTINPKEGYVGFNNFHSIWGIIEWYLNQNNLQECSVRYIMDNLIKQFLFSHINSVCDLHSDNWGLLNKDGQVDVYPMFDNGAFSDYFEIYNRFSNGFNITIYSSELLRTSDEAIIRFMNISEYEYFKVIENMILKLLNLNIKQFLDRVEHKYNLPITDRREFEENYQRRIDSLMPLLLKLSR